MIGQTISHYRILEKLGEGGMGVVYKAEDLRLGRTVALKFLPSDTPPNPEARARITSEARAAAALDHPNICTVHEIDEVNGQIFIVMAYLVGRTLHEELARGRMDPAMTVEIATQMARGLRHAHERGVVHREIKPANILISADGPVKIMDFGLAKLVGQTQVTKAGTVLGTIGYMSPEQTRGQELDQQTDIWSFGVVLREMLSGRRPLCSDLDPEAGPSFDVEKQGSEQRLGMPPPLRRIVTKAMTVDRNARYQSFDEILVDLQHFDPTPTAPTEALPVRGRPHKKMLLWAGSAAMGVLALLAAHGPASAEPRSLLVVSAAPVPEPSVRLSVHTGLSKQRCRVRDPSGFPPETRKSLFFSTFLERTVEEIDPGN